MTDGLSTVEALHAEITALRARVAELEQELGSARAVLGGAPRRGMAAPDPDLHPDPSTLLKQAAEDRAAALAATTERARFYSLLMDVPSGILLLRGREMVAELVNPRYLDLIFRKDILGMPIREFLPEVVEQGFLALLQRVYDSGEPFIGTEVMVRLDRSGNGQLNDYWFTFIYQPVSELDGTRSGVLVHATEVTESVLARRKVQDEIRERMQTEEELRAKLSIIQRQEEAILALATPILQIWDGVIALPVIGTVDSARAGRMMEGLLDAITRTRARFAVLDLTGVEVMDTQAAAHLLKLVRAAGLLGNRCLISGISPGVAQTMVALNLEIIAAMSFNTLEAALRYAIRHLDTTR